ncbi:MAG: hypothetical protein ACFB22_11795 [Rhodothalassiaceae bacterium]
MHERQPSISSLASGAHRPLHHPARSPLDLFALAALALGLLPLTAAALGLAPPVLVMALLVTVGQGAGGWFIFLDAYEGARDRRIGVALQISLASAAAWLHSVLLWAGQGPSAGPGMALYGLSLLTVAQLVRTFPVRAEPRPAAPPLETALGARRASDGEPMSPDQLHPGVIIKLGLGDQLPADGEVSSGAVELDYAEVTGNPVPRPAQRGWPVKQGGRVRAGTAEVTLKAPPQSLLPDVVAPTPAPAESDRFARLLLALAVTVALAAGGIAALAGGAAVLAALAVIAAAGAPALVLATPWANRLLLKRGHDAGVVVHDLSVFDRAPRLRHVLIGWHGVVTSARASIGPVKALEGEEAELLAQAAAIVPADGHALAPALTAAAEAAGAVVPMASERSGLEVGRGYRGVVQTRTILLGNPSLLAAHNVGYQRLAEAAEAMARDGGTVLWAAEAAPRQRPLGLIAVADRPRAAVLQRARLLSDRGLQLRLLAPDPASDLKPYAARLKGLTALAGPAAVRAEAVMQLKQDGPVAVIAAAPLDRTVYALADVRISPADADPFLAAHADVRLRRNEQDRLLRAFSWLRAVGHRRKQARLAAVALQVALMILAPVPAIPVVLLTGLALAAAIGAAAAQGMLAPDLD